MFVMLVRSGNGILRRYVENFLQYLRHLVCQTMGCSMNLHAIKRTRGTSFECSLNVADVLRALLLGDFPILIATVVAFKETGTWASMNNALLQITGE